MRSRLTPLALAALGGLLVHSTGGGGLLDGRVLDAAQRARRGARVRPVVPDVALIGASRESLASWHEAVPGLLRALDLGRAEGVGLLPPLAGGHAGLVFQAPFGTALPVITEGAAPGPALAPATLRGDPDGGVRRLTLSAADGRGSLVARLAGGLGVAPRPGLVDYGLGRPFDYDPLDAILRWERAGDWEALEKKLRGRPVIVGAIGEGTARRTTPIPLAGWEPGASDSPELMAHAQALRTLIGGVPQLGAPWLTLVLVVLAAGVGGSARRPLVGAIGAGAALLALWFLELWLLDRSSWLPPAGPVVALVLGWLLPRALARA